MVRVACKDDRKSMNSDNLYKAFQKEVSAFDFSTKVAEVFDDMVERSIPGYHQILNNIDLLVQQFAQTNSSLYDLGCSTGNTLLHIFPHLKHFSLKVKAIDNSQAMLEKCKKKLLTLTNPSMDLSFECQNIENILIKQASIVILNFTLQFIAPQNRHIVLKNIFEGLQTKGILILSEKICFHNTTLQKHITQLHHQFKKQQGYSQLEISQKRSALENVLIPDTYLTLCKRLKKAGFIHFTVHFQQLNFVSLVAFK